MEETKKKSGFATAGLVLGIIGAVLSFIPIVNNVAFILGILGIIFAIVSLAKKASKGMAIAGLILSILACFITYQMQSAFSDALNEVTAEVTSIGTTNESKENGNQKTITKVNVGEEVSTDKEKISFKSASDYTGYSSYSKPKTGNKIIRAEFGFENISSSDIILDSFECYADGEKCESYYYPDDYKSPSLESLSAGKKMTGIVYYEVPSGAESIILEYETNFWTDNKVEFVVK